VTDPGNRLMHDQAQISALPARGGARTFRNEPLLELRREAVRREAQEALATLDAKLPLEVPMLIGDSVVTGRKFASVDPSQPTRIVAHAHEATEQHVKDAIVSAETGHPMRVTTISANAARRRHLGLTAPRASSPSPAGPPTGGRGGGAPPAQPPGG